MDFPRLTWTCPQCQKVLDALSTTGLEIHKRLHIDAHHRLWVGSIGGLMLYKGRALIDPGDVNSGWQDWDDYEWLMRDMKIDPFGQDERTDAELKARYKAKT